MNSKQMFFKKSSALLLALGSLTVIGLSAFSLFPNLSLPVAFVKSGPHSSLTGLPGKDGEVLVVKLDDTTYAHPQVGLRSADVVYIEQVEGGLTRLAAVFSSKIPDLVGPVRSARISDIELLSQYGKVGFAFSGAQKLMLPVIASANLYDLSANKFGAKFYANDPARIAPYAMMMKASDLVSEAKVQGMNLVTASSMGWKFGDQPDQTIAISKVHISWPASSYDATWSTEEDRWLLTHNGNLDTDDTGYVLGPKTLIIEIVSITDSIYHDKVGGVTPFSATVGEGKCYLLRNGSYSPCLWHRSSAEAGTTFTDSTGSELLFDKGQIWFALTSKDPLFTQAKLQDATTSASK
jgi:Protein of unknown function (DUF3048) N-terminal domain/Protein of unknown function (DUF3048) C-terminal domain